MICTARVIDCKQQPQGRHQQIKYSTSLHEKKNRSFSGSRKIPTLGSIVHWETRQASFPTGREGPRVRIFLSPLNNNDGFHFSQIAIPARVKDKKRTAERRPHDCRTSIRDVIVMLQLPHHVTSQRNQDLFEVFFMYFQYKMRYLVVSMKKNPLVV